MDISQVIDFANENPISYIATSENNVPHVRGFLMWFADKTGFYFHTGTVKKIYKQLKDNPAIEICQVKFISETESKMLRVNGIVEFIRDETLSKRLLEERPWLSEISKARPETGIAIFRIVKGEAHFWDMSVNLNEDKAPRVNFDFS